MHLDAESFPGGDVPSRPGTDHLRRGRRQLAGVRPLLVCTAACVLKFCSGDIVVLFYVRGG